MARGMVEISFFLSKFVQHGLATFLAAKAFRMPGSLAYLEVFPLYRFLASMASKHLLLLF